MLPLLLLTPHNWFIASGPSQVWAGGSWGYFRTARDLANCEVISGGRRLETLTCFYMPDSWTTQCKTGSAPGEASDSDVKFRPKNGSIELWSQSCIRERPGVSLNIIDQHQHQSH